ncbi:hypothetical protein [Methylocella tundrae]|uniref:hypothetical protein n=1 Tax=Methylocella tundrae TaxID=227605 RepID=UPI00157AC843|nr:hypothetical protein [Methylocella tundrae]
MQRAETPSGVFPFSGRPPKEPVEIVNLKAAHDADYPMNQPGLAIRRDFVVRREALKKYFLCVSGKMSKVATPPNKGEHWNMHEICVAHFGSSKAAAGD